MNIKNRLKKMQKQIIGNDSEFCDCEKEVEIIVIVPTADGGKATLDGKPYEESNEQTTALCQRCDKPSREPFHFSFTITPKVKLN